MTVDFACYQTRRRSDTWAFVTESLRKAPAKFVRCRERQVKLESGKTKTFAPEPDSDADPIDAVAALTGVANTLAPRLIVLKQGTHCQWNQALRCSTAPDLLCGPACLVQAPQRGALIARSRQPTQACNHALQAHMQKAAAPFCFVISSLSFFLHQ